MGGSGSHDKNYKQAFPPHQALYCWRFTFLTTSLTAAMVDIGTTIDSQLCGLANVKCLQGKLNHYPSAKLTQSRNIFQLNSSVHACACVCACVCSVFLCAFLQWLK